MSIKLFRSSKFNAPGTCFPSPPPQLNGLPCIRTSHEPYSSALKKNKYNFREISHFSKWQVSHYLIIFLYANLVLIHFYGSRSVDKISPVFCCSNVSMFMMHFHKRINFKVYRNYNLHLFILCNLCQIHAFFVEPFLFLLSFVFPVLKFNSTCFLPSLQEQCFLKNYFWRNFLLGINHTEGAGWITFYSKNR